MKSTVASLSVIALVTASVGGQAASKPDPVAIARLLRQLESLDFKTRDAASRELETLEEVPDALRAAVASPNAEVARRAGRALAVISARIQEKEIQAMLGDLSKVELDRLVRAMVADAKLTGEKQWTLMQTLARAMTKTASRLAERPFSVDFDVRSMRRRLVNGYAEDLDHDLAEVSDTVLLSAGPVPRMTGFRNSLVVVDGDFLGATGIDNCLLIVRGNVGRCTSIRGSILLATGHFEGATSFDHSFLQAANHEIRFTGSRDSVLVNTLVTTNGATDSRVLPVDRGPLNLLKFSPRKPDGDLSWGKPVNDLIVAIAPAEQTGQFLIRWKNIGSEALSLPWVRLRGDALDEKRDDLLNHVFLKGEDGKLSAARKHPAPRASAFVSDRSVLLAPGQSHEEIINLWTYVEKPPPGPRYALSIELDIEKARAVPWRGKTWIGKIQSNTLDITIGK